MVHQHFTHLLLVLNDFKCMIDIPYHLVTLSIPKVAKNGQKVPISANSEIRVDLYGISASVISGRSFQMFYYNN